MPGTYVLDTSLLLGGKEPPVGARWVTTPEAAAEVSPGGRDAARFERWFAAGLRVQQADAAARETVQAVAREAGNLARLSEADVSLAALALATGGILVTDDHTLLDVALRLGVPTQTVMTEGIRGPLSFRPRCSGCGRWFDAPSARADCPVCGSPVKDRPWPPGTRRHAKGSGERAAAGPAAAGSPRLSPAGGAKRPGEPAPTRAPEGGAGQRDAARPGAEEAGP